MYAALRRRQRHDDLSRLGKFDRIANNIEQNLAQTPRITEHPVRHIVGNITNQLKPFFAGAQTQGFESIHHRFRQVEADPLNLQFASLNLGEVENVINDGQQRFGRCFDDADEFPLLVIQLSIQRQIGHADNAVHWRANLVAHIGQEETLCCTGLIGKLAGANQCGFKHFLGGYIGADRGVFDRFSIRPDKRHDGRRHPVKTAILLAILHLAMPDLALRDGPPHLAKDLRQVNIRLDDAVIFAQQLIPGIAADFAKAIIDVGNHPGDIGTADNGVLIDSKFLKIQFTQSIAKPFQTARNLRHFTGLTHLINHNIGATITQLFQRAADKSKVPGQLARQVGNQQNNQGAEQQHAETNQQGIAIICLRLLIESLLNTLVPGLNIGSKTLIQLIQTQGRIDQIAIRQARIKRQHLDCFQAGLPEAVKRFTHL